MGVGRRRHDPLDHLRHAFTRGHTAGQDLQRQ
jgi:hypothetical protein